MLLLNVPKARTCPPSRPEMTRIYPPMLITGAPSKGVGTSPSPTPSKGNQEQKRAGALLTLPPKGIETNPSPTQSKGSQEQKRAKALLALHLSFCFGLDRCRLVFDLIRGRVTHAFGRPDQRFVLTLALAGKAQLH